MLCRIVNGSAPGGASKNRDKNRGVNHSQHTLPIKTCIRRRPASPRWWRDRKIEIARVARAHTAHASDGTHSQITAWQTRTRWSMRVRESIERVPQRRVRASIPTLSHAALCTSTYVTAHATLAWMPCSATRCGVVEAVSAASLEMAEAEEDCERGAGRRGICRSSACASKGHEQSAREHERWQGECGRAGAPYSVELVEPSVCEFGSRTGDPPALHRAELCEDSKQQTGTSK